MDVNALTICILSLGLSIGLTPLVRLVALQRGWVARPKSDRWHKQTTALMGGIAIFTAFAVPTLLISDFESLWRFFYKPGGAAPPSLAATLFLGAAFLFAIGLVDDFKNIKPQSKLIAQILTASLVTFVGFRLQWFDSLTLDTMATIFWIVGITNAFNLIDNMDGLCAGVGLVASLGLAVLFQPVSPEAFLLCLAFTGALAGFLVFNFNPAKIFMGDCGSLVIGFSLSVLSLYFVPTGSSTNLAAIAVPILILLVPILDTTLVTVIRMLSGRKASTGGRDHTSHRLVLIGLSEKSAVLYLYAVGAVSGLAAVFVSRSNSMTSPMVIVPMGLAVLLMGIYLAQLRVYPEKEFSALRNRSFTPVLLELTYKRQLLLVVLDFILVAFAYYVSYRLRFNDPEFSLFFKVFLRSLPVIIGCKLTVFFLMGVYRGLWRYISTADVCLYIRASLAGTLVSIAAVTFIYRFEHFSKGTFIIDWIVTTGLLLGVRGSFRVFLEIQKRKTLCGDKVVIYGAGRGGELLLREILNNKALSVDPIGFIDDDPLKLGRKIQGFPILGNCADIERLHRKYHLSGVLISFNEVNGHSCAIDDEVKAFCRTNGIFLKRFRVNLQKVALEA
jgi:UDP-GlcNAc:undecaprenyl-phosphate/decaprenyl-phosphate GlcNAc-1-phosphate transferase